jgi:hypothetical protein
LGNSILAIKGVPVKFKGKLIMLKNIRPAIRTFSLHQKCNLKTVT